ncbi:GTPase-activating protein RGD1 Ecym_2335 [Eremothecium cymbalariae DBVPG|uniref:Rho-GAP domain-containing protein n=1 Tax=Eremothecium cymbalariae (strain CBS 270.75 / DBVPG 7215 / KCTC 17166 / NRRL Y-17582) TaxID=931890 RepID=G8JQ72_ERECY|nr:Hypothetical protein Ecym_2335 [Eremothecium cymbalariae DBVPG\
MSQTVKEPEGVPAQKGKNEVQVGGRQGLGDPMELLNAPEIQKLMESDVSPTALLNRLKMSLLMCVEFTKFVRKKYILEEEHAQEMSKAYKNFFPDTGASSLQASMHKVLEYDGKLAKVKMSYVSALQKIYDELSALLATMTKIRKTLKENSRRLEKEVADAIHSAEKAKSKYMALCQDWEKLKLVDPAKTKLTLRGSRTTREQEEELLRKIDTADLDYKQKVDYSTSLRNTYISNERPKIVTELKDLILELNTAVSIQLQKYAIWTENLILNSGVTIIPFETTLSSMKDHASSMNNQLDLFEYLSKYTSKNGTFINKSLIPVDYRKHPAMIKSGIFSTQSSSSSSFQTNLTTNTLPKRVISTSNESPFDSKPSPPTSSSAKSSPTPNSFPLNSGPQQPENSKMLIAAADKIPETRGKFGTLDPGSRKGGQSQPSLVTSIVTTFGSQSPISKAESMNTLPPGVSNNMKTFSVPLEDLLEYEQDLVPAIVRQCIYVVDKYGLYLEGIYRRSANVLDVSRLREDIDKDPSNISMLLPPKNYTDSDIYLVGSLLKTFFASLPDPLLSRSMSDELTTCLSIENPTTRKNYLHGLIYKLPDCQYWTLRSLIFHLKRVLDREEENRMNRKALCIIWGPTIVPPKTDDINDVNHQINVMDVLFDVADQAFEPE